MHKEKVYSYVRLSSAEQIKGHGAKRQLEKVQEYADHVGLPLDTALKDLGKSAFHGDHLNGALGGFIKQVEEGQVVKGSILYIENLDRLSREAVPDALEQFLRLLNNGIKIYTAMDRMLYSRESVRKNTHELMMSIFVMARAHEESATKSSRLKAKWKNRRDNATKEPMTSIRPCWLDWDADTKTFSVNEKALIVQRIYHETAELGFGKELIARRFNEENVPLLTPRSKRKSAIGWHGGMITHILDARNVFGELTPHIKDRTAKEHKRPAADPIPGYYPAIISRALFDKAQAVRRANDKTGGRRGKRFNNLFVGKVFCKECGGICRVRSGRNGYTSYTCDLVE